MISDMNWCFPSKVYVNCQIEQEVKSDKVENDAKEYVYRKALRGADNADIFFDIFFDKGAAAK
jgi:hypothetical protein